MTRIDEIGPDLFRVSTFVPEIDMQFNQFLVRDEEPLLFHTGLKAHFQSTFEAVKKVIRPDTLRWIAFSHFEADEWGALAEWQQVAPVSTAACSVVAKMVSVDDSAALRPSRGLMDGDLIKTGTYRFRWIQTPHVPHCWEAGLLFEETNRTLFCSDLFHHSGDVEATTSADVVGRFRDKLLKEQGSPFAHYIPWTTRTEQILRRLAASQPSTFAVMHGSSYTG
ncbi:MAG: MBL fold metallo-hydrolase, partial [Nitrospiraceae bacterium]